MQPSATRIHVPVTRPDRRAHNRAALALSVATLLGAVLARSAAASAQGTGASVPSTEGALAVLHAAVLPFATMTLDVVMMAQLDADARVPLGVSVTNTVLASTQLIAATTLAVIAFGTYGDEPTRVGAVVSLVQGGLSLAYSLYALTRSEAPATRRAINARAFRSQHLALDSVVIGRIRGASPGLALSFRF